MVKEILDDSYYCAVLIEVRSKESSSELSSRCLMPRTLLTQRVVWQLLATETTEHCFCSPLPTGGDKLPLSQKTVKPAWNWQ